jgi:hypothetical protein
MSAHLRPRRDCSWDRHYPGDVGYLERDSAPGARAPGLLNRRARQRRARRRARRAALRRAEGRPRRAGTGAAACSAYAPSSGLASLDQLWGDAHVHALQPPQACVRGASLRGVSVPVRGAGTCGVLAEAISTDTEDPAGRPAAELGAQSRLLQARARRAWAWACCSLCLRAQGRAGGLLARKAALWKALGGRRT